MVSDIQVLKIKPVYRKASKQENSLSLGSNNYLWGGMQIDGRKYLNASILGGGEQKDVVHSVSMS